MSDKYEYRCTVCNDEGWDIDPNGLFYCDNDECKALPNRTFMERAQAGVIMRLVTDELRRRGDNREND